MLNSIIRLKYHFDFLCNSIILLSTWLWSPQRKWTILSLKPVVFFLSCNPIKLHLKNLLSCTVKNIEFLLCFTQLVRKLCLQKYILFAKHTLSRCLCRREHCWQWGVESCFSSLFRLGQEEQGRTKATSSQPYS